MHLSNILFLDIETVPQYPAFEKAEETYQKLWEEKARFLLKTEEDTPASVFERAGIYAEFGKIVCISVGIINDRGPKRELRIKSYANEDEAALLKEFNSLLDKHFSGDEHLLCGHNGKEFDFPYIARRMLIHGMPLPRILDIAGKKPWEIKHLDTMQMWKFGDFKNFTSLKLLAHVFGLPTPKDDIDGSQVAGVFWEEKNLPRIVTYCEKDVVTLVQVFLRMNQMPMLTDEELDS
ncbi:MAG: 3'-5' exonuclease [Flavobacteriales bacterium]|nr:3'-5' exonuclease [Flavobacteriales bacterium]